ELTRKLQSLVDRVRTRELSVREFYARLRASGCSPEEGRDYVDQVSRIVLERVKEMRERRSPSPIPNRNAAVEEAAWASLRSVLHDAENTANLRSSDAPVPPAPLVPVTAPALVTSSVPELLLAVAPHLAELDSTKQLSAHLRQTWELRRAFADTECRDWAVSRLSACHFTDPLPSQLLKLVVEDKYVDFDKVHGAIGQSSSVAFYDEPKDFLGDLKLLRSDQLIRKLAVVTEAQWLRTYDAWCAAVIIIYKHRTEELAAYKASIISLFRASPDPAQAIRIDKEVREHYARSPFELDQSDTFHLPLLSELLHASPSSSSAGVKRSRGTPAATSSSKRSKSICENWNLDFCKAEKCPQGRIHGICSECGSQHRAKDSSTCFDLLSARQRARNRRESD
ncbi:hypothetical protein K435DRAFT_916470, partial [Dendrothele bispora CBS 962.96]